jgi:1-deoxy-D-xylulose-5-phosphate synthase
MTVFAPSSAQELQVMLHDALACDGPAAVRWPKGQARIVGDEEVGSGLQARQVRSGGQDVCILAVGKMVGHAEKAATLLAEEGIDATVWDVRVVKPLDPAMLDDAAQHRLVLTVEDGIRDGGVGSLIAADLTACCAGRSKPRVEILGVPVQFIPHGKPDRILARLGLDADGIVASVTAALDRTPT